ncbi:MAG: TIM-barrel domain-containing protein [Flammeovirgaceae bacterium]
MKYLLIVALLAISPSCLIGQNQERNYLSHQLEAGKLTISTSDGNYQIKLYNDYIVETAFIPKGEAFDHHSHAVVMQPTTVKAKLLEKGNVLEYRGTVMSVKISKKPFQIRYEYKGKALISEKAGYVHTDSAEIINFNLDQEEALYGGGARVLGMNRRGNRLPLYNKAHYGYETRSELMNFTLPIVMSSKRYAIHFDNAPIGYLDLDSKNDNSLTYETISGRMTYQVIADDTWEGILKNYTALTGRQPLPPRWAFGNFASRFGYHSEKETRMTVDKFFEDQIPMDAVIIDIYWFGKDIKGHMGNLSFLKDSFPTPQKMIDDFKAKGVKTILITEPFVLTTSNRWDEAVKEKVLGLDSTGNPYKFNFYFGETGLIDIYSEQGKKWFWNIYKEFTEMGVAGWWGDLGEPEVHPGDLQHATGSGNEVHNIYGHDWAALVYNGYQKDFPDQRPFILMRAGYSGSQRYGLIPWSGDVSRSWGGLQAQTEIALQMGMQGIGYMHSDLGGFAGGETFDAELYTRWLQYGVFQPIFRPHAQEHIPAEPVFHDEKTKALAKKSIELRYSLLPYNYTLAFENSQSGIPFMRPLLFEDQDNQEMLSEKDTYLWGDAFLVSPIMAAGVTQQEVVFPKNHVWFDFYTNKKYEGGSKRKVATAEDHIPTFVRAGAFIPMVKPVQTTEAYSTKRLDLHYYHDASVAVGKGQMYHDDGKTPDAFAKGKYELLQFASKYKNGQLTVSLAQEKGSQFTGESRQVQLIIHNVFAKPSKLKAGKEKPEIVWNEVDHTLRVPITWDGAKTVVKVKF